MGGEGERGGGGFGKWGGGGGRGRVPMNNSSLRSYPHSSGAV